MTRLIFVNRYFYPDQSATSQVLSDLAFDLAARGRDVHVVTSRQLYEDPKARLPAEETVYGVHVHRVYSTRFGRGFLPGRAADYVSFYGAVSRLLTRLAERGDVIVAKTDPPMISVPAMRAARRKQAHLVNWLQDIYPEIAVELGVPIVRGPALSFLSQLRDASLRAAAANVVVGPHMAERLRARGIADERIRTIANWSNDEAIMPVAPADNPLRRAWNLDGKFVVGYSGNLGRTHEFDTILEASEILHDDTRIVFVLIGGGHGFDALAKRVRARGLTSYRFMPYHPRSALHHSLGVADLHWVSLKAKLDGLMFPSKIYAVAAAGRPMLALSAANGDLAQLIRQYDCGITIEPGNSQAVAAAIVELAGNAERRAAMGRRARAMVEGRLSRRHALESWRKLIDEIDGTRAEAPASVTAAA